MQACLPSNIKPTFSVHTQMSALVSSAHVIPPRQQAGHEGSVSIRPNLDLDCQRNIVSRLLNLKSPSPPVIFSLPHVVCLYQSSWEQPLLRHWLECRLRTVRPASHQLSAQLPYLLPHLISTPAIHHALTSPQSVCSCARVKVA